MKRTVGFLGLGLWLLSGLAQGGDLTREYFTHPDNVGKNLPFSEGVMVGETLYLAGQLGIPPGEGELVEGGMEPEARQTLDNIKGVLYTFFRDGKLIKIPAGMPKKRIVAAELAKQFSPFRNYTEKEVNRIIGSVHPDYCTLRRLLVDLGYLNRHQGIYRLRAILVPASFMVKL